MVTTTVAPGTIKKWLDQADALDQELEPWLKKLSESENLRWKIAEALYLAQAGKKGIAVKQTQDELAKAIGRSQSTVSKYIKCWNKYGPNNQGAEPRLPWAAAWRKVTTGEGKPNSHRKPRLPGETTRPQVPLPAPSEDYSQGNAGSSRTRVEIRRA